MSLVECWIEVWRWVGGRTWGRWVHDYDDFVLEECECENHMEETLVPECGGLTLEDYL